MQAGVPTGIQIKLPQEGLQSGCRFGNLVRNASNLEDDLKPRPEPKGLKAIEFLKILILQARKTKASYKLKP